jgi:plasmid stabilization system protein ParE
LKYRVIVTPQAEQDLRVAYSYIRKRGSLAAARTWLAAIRKRIKTLGQNPERAALAPASSSFSEPIRELLHGSGNRGIYRILFMVLDGSVFVLHVRHGSMLPLELEE